MALHVSGECRERMQGKGLSPESSRTATMVRQAGQIFSWTAS
jgi:hypothetical protein